VILNNLIGDAMIVSAATKVLALHLPVS
jgi:hypothetical protein